LNALFVEIEDAVHQFEVPAQLIRVELRKFDDEHKTRVTRHRKPKGSPRQGHNKMNQPDLRRGRV